VATATGGGAAMAVRIDLFPEMEEAALAALIARRIARDPAKPLELSFVGLLHKRLIAVLLKEAGLRRICRRDAGNSACRRSGRSPRGSKLGRLRSAARSRG